jgi:hypothetical protein
MSQVPFRIVALPHLTRATGSLTSPLTTIPRGELAQISGNAAATDESTCKMNGKMNGKMNAKMNGRIDKPKPDCVASPAVIGFHRVHEKRTPR